MWDNLWSVVVFPNDVPTDLKNLKWLIAWNILKWVQTKAVQGV